MNPDYFPIVAFSWTSLVIWWCVGCLLLGLCIGWLLWRNADREALALELENRKAQKDFEKREKNYSSNRELIKSMLDPDSES